MFPCISWEKSSFAFCPGKKDHILGGKKKIFPDNTRKSMCRRGTFWKDHIPRGFEENIIFPCIFKERSTFIFRLICKIIFSGKRNIIFPDNTRKIIFQSNYFGKTIFSGPLEKENMVFCAAFSLVVLLLIRSLKKHWLVLVSLTDTDQQHTQWYNTNKMVTIVLYSRFDWSYYRKIVCTTPWCQS